MNVANIVAPLAIPLLFLPSSPTVEYVVAIPSWIFYVGLGSSFGLWHSYYSDWLSSTFKQEIYLDKKG